MRKITHLTIILWLLCFVGCERSPDEFRDQYRWISGKWVGKDGESNVIEYWKWNKFRFEGKGFRTLDGDTTTTESLFISNYDGVIGYTALINHERLYSFQKISSQNDSLIFVNNQNDFPKKITYALIQDDVLLIELEGEVGPKKVKVDYTLKREERKND
jgi:hypothetical protein